MREVCKKVKQKLSYAKKNWPAKLAKYEQQEEILAGRGSYSKTDVDATFMRMKEDHMGNGQLKAGYNLQISTAEQIITHFSIHQKPADTTTLIPHFEEFKQLYGQLPEVITADAGYGSEENYHYLEQKGVDAFIKYSYFHQEQKQAGKGAYPLSDVRQLHYNKEQDCYYCPMGQKMVRVGSKQRTTENGYVQQYAVYQAIRCEGCPLRGLCHKSKYDRKIEVNHRLNQLKGKAREMLLSEEGVKHRKKRPADVEAAFGNLKQNKNFKRFRLRGRQKVEIEVGLVAIAHNLAKMAA